jgi:Fic family protein
MYIQVKKFYADLPCKKANLNAIELAAWAHAEFVKIHPFADGNGRTSRMIMNYQLMSCGFLPVSIPKESRLSYFDALEAYAVNGDPAPFADMVAGLEEARLDWYVSAIEMQQGQSPIQKM